MITLQEKHFIINATIKDQHSSLLTQKLIKVKRVEFLEVLPIFHGQKGIQLITVLIIMFKDKANHFYFLYEMMAKS